MRLVELLRYDLEDRHGLVFLVDQCNVPARHVHDVASEQGRRVAPRCLTETEAGTAAFRVARLKIEHAVFAEIASRSMNVLLAVAVGGVLITDILGSTSDVAVTFLAVRELVVTSSASVALSALDIFLAFAVSRQKIALKMSVEDTVGMTLTLLATDYLMVAVGSGFALIASRSNYVRWTRASSSLRFASSGTGTVAGSAVGKAEVAGLTNVTATADDVVLTRTLTTEFLALKTKRTVDVATAG